MSEYTDYMEEQFFNHVLTVRDKIESRKTWLSVYKKQREDYPSWVTREGKSIKIQDITDSHLNNLLSFMPKDSTWHKAFEYEKRCREYEKELQSLEKENEVNETVIDNVF